MDITAYIASIQTRIDDTQLNIDNLVQYKINLAELKTLVETNADVARVLELIKNFGVL